MRMGWSKVMWEVEERKEVEVVDESRLTGFRNRYLVQDTVKSL